MQNAAVFLLRVITHDWADDFVTRILLQLRHAATPKTKLIMADYILPLACEDDSEDTGVVRTLAPPGSGLLPNLGKASANAFWLDMTVSYDRPIQVEFFFIVSSDAGHIQQSRTYSARND